MTLFTKIYPLYSVGNGITDLGIWARFQIANWYFTLFMYFLKQALGARKDDHSVLVLVFGFIVDFLCHSISLKPDFIAKIINT